MSKRRWVTGVFLFAWALVGCTQNSSGSSGETHFITCNTDADCVDASFAHTCVEHICRPTGVMGTEGGAQQLGGGPDASIPDSSIPDAIAESNTKLDGAVGAEAGANPDAATTDGNTPVTVDCASYALSGASCLETADCRPGLDCTNNACTARASSACSTDDECGHLSRCHGETVTYTCVSRATICVDSTDCAVGFRCGTDGKCAAGPTDGQPAVYDAADLAYQCARGYYADANLTCRALVSLGGLCFCSGASCSNFGVDTVYSARCVEGAGCLNARVGADGTSAGTCTLPGTGDCSYTASCATGYVCYGGQNTDKSNQGACVAQTSNVGDTCAIGSACVDADCYDEGLCKKGLYCGSHGCAPLPKPGEPCVTSLRQPCGPDQYCDAGGVCRVKAAAGAKCDAPMLCAADSSCQRNVPVSGSCVDDVCLPASCTPGCKTATCGDNVTCCGLEECDDGNTRAGDGCSAACTVEPVAVATNGLSTCALGSNGFVKCWGENSNGILGRGTTRTAVSPLDQFAQLPIVQLGTGQRAKRIWSLNQDNCAQLRDNSVKCWGYNLEGELGLGDTATRGDEPGEMGDDLPAIDVGTGRTIKDIGNGSAILDDGTFKYWSGLLGSPGTEKGGMGDNLPVTDLGTLHRATSVDGIATTCVTFDDGSLKCWGDNSGGQLGAGDKTSTALSAAVPNVNVGTGRRVTSVAVGTYHICAILDGGAVKCWGNGGLLGLGDTDTRGDGPGEMGDALPALALGTGRTATMLAAGDDDTCALLDNGSVKCWGDNGYGELGQGDTKPRGNAPNEMGDSLKAVDLGTGRTAKSITAYQWTVCALLDNGTIKCWGLDVRDSSTTRGDKPGQMGDNLLALGVTF